MICCGVSTPFTNRSVSHRSSVPSRPKIWQKSFNPVYKPVSLTPFGRFDLAPLFSGSFNPVYKPVSLTPSSSYDVVGNRMVSTPFTNRSASQLIQIISLFGQSKVSTPFTNRSASQLYCLGHTRLGTHVSTPFTNRSASQQYLFFPVGNQSVIRSFPAHARYAAADIPPTPLESPISSIIPRPGAYASLFSLYSIDITGYFRIHLLGGADFFLAAGLIDFI